jgi:hypothetical protein
VQDPSFFLPGVDATTTARPLSLPPLNLLASLRARQVEENGDAAARPSLPAQRQVTKSIMQGWLRHTQILQNPAPRMRDVHLLHLAQSVPMIDENSALRGNMPQRDDEDDGKKPRLSFSPASSAWGQTGCSWTSKIGQVTGTTGKITEADYVAFFHQFFGFTNNPALPPFANVQCPCQLYDDDPFIVLTETKFSICYIPVWSRYSHGW